VVGLSLLLPAVLGQAPNDGKADWMASGFAILLIVAISPVALFQGIRFAHGTAATVARGWGSTAAYMLPIPALTRAAGGLLAPKVQGIRKWAGAIATDRLQRMKRGREGGR
jgi:hypothetical protein